MTDPVVNFGEVLVSGVHSSGATSILLQTGEGAKLPSPIGDGEYDLTFWNFTDYPRASDDPNVEIVRVTGKTGDTLTVTRGQQDTTPSSKNTAGKQYMMALTPTKGWIEQLLALIDTYLPDSYLDTDTALSANSDAKIASQKATKAYVDTPRVTNIVSDATPDYDVDDCKFVNITAQAADITSMTSGQTGTPQDFQTLIFRIKDDGTARAITWGSLFEAKGQELPTTTVIGKVLQVGFIYDTVTDKWGCVAVSQEV